AHHTAVFHEALHHGAREVHRHGETNALVAAAVTEDGGVDANQSPFRIDERATGITRVNGRVGLNHVFVIETQAATTRGADDAARDGLADAERIANREHHIADFELVTVREFDGR